MRLFFLYEILCLYFIEGNCIFFLYGRIDQERKKEMKINQETLSKYLGQQISTTNDPKKFGNYYDQAIAKIQLEEFGVIYYYSKLLEPVEPDDIYRLLEG